MTSITQTLMHNIDSAETVDSIWGLGLDYFRSIGIDYVIYVYCRGYKNTYDDTVFLSNMDRAWTSRYEQKKYAEIDPFFKHCCNSYDVMKTGVEYMHDYDFMDDTERAFISEAGRLTGFTAGCSLVMRRKGVGPDFGGWNIGTRLTRKEFDVLYNKHATAMLLAATYIHEKLNMVLNKDLKETQHYLQQPLSNQQLKCLTLIAQGKRTQSIAELMQIKPVTVEHHVKQAKIKLQANTREQAVARAIIKGLISV